MRYKIPSYVRPLLRGGKGKKSRYNENPAVGIIYSVQVEERMGSVVPEMMAAPKTKGYNNYFVSEKELKYLPPYFRDTAETPEEAKCEVQGTWPEWLEGTFVRLVSSILLFIERS